MVGGYLLGNTAMGRINQRCLQMIPDDRGLLQVRKLTLGDVHHVFDFKGSRFQDCFDQVAPIMVTLDPFKKLHHQSK